MNFLTLLIGVVCGVVATMIVMRRRAAAPASTPAPVAAPEPKTIDATPEPAEATPAEEPLSAKLHRLSATLEPFGDNTAHPQELSDRPEFPEAVKLLSSKDVSKETVVQYALGANWTLSCAALVALAKRDDGQSVSDQIAASFGRLRPWALYYALEYMGELKDRPAAGELVVNAEAWWADNLVIPAMFKAYFTKVEKLGDIAWFGGASVASSDVEGVEAFLKSLNHPFANELIKELLETRAAKIDNPYLESFGRFWTRSDDDSLVIEPDEWKDLLVAAEAAITQAVPRSLIVRGDPKVGKSSFLRLLGLKLMKKGWTIFEAGGPELQAGQSYIGQLEERVKRMAAELSPQRRALWYVPDILQVAVSGTHHGQTASILDQVFPALSSGRLVIIGEATPTQVTQLVQLKPKTGGVFEVAPLTSMSEARTLVLAETLLVRLKSKTRVAFEGNVAPLALQLGRQYLGTSQLPGSVLSLIRQTVTRAVAEHAKSVTPRDILATLSATTGLPIAILDSSEKVELEGMQRFFGERVMGQREAVQSVVDRIAMLKAGLTDPTKPIGVFLFAGPTGTGKTELAKTLAEYLFGSAERLIRLDMSEFKTPESMSKIIGDAGGAMTSDSLINRVRKQPFSVVLLDEFEKAHPNIWDLFLQVFDDGRLSDGAGNVADFRHCIIILTSNLGATSHQSPALGFGAKAEEFSSDQIMRAIGQAFRPEFVNRLDKVIVFQPLKRELMKEILHKELKLVLERRGLRSREWAVEWESSALDFLLDRGFSPELGARPLKRAIDQYLLAPLAATIVEHRFPEGDQFLFVRSDGKAVQVEFVDPDADHGARATAAGGTAPPLAEIILSAYGSAEERATLENEYRHLTARLADQPWRELTDKLNAELANPAIWSRADRYEVLARYALLDRVKAAFKTAEALRERLDKSRDARGDYSRELMGRLAQQVFVVGQGVEDAMANAPVEAIVAVDIALEGSAEPQEAQMWCNQVLGMYRAWAEKRGMQIDTHVAGDDTLLAVSGFGAFRFLEGEAGLHVLEPGEDEKDVPRLTARVRIAAAPLGNIQPAALPKALRKAIDGAAVSNAITRRYRGGGSPLVRDAKGGWRSGKFEAILGGDVDLIGAVAAR